MPRMLEIIDGAGNVRAIESITRMAQRTEFGIQKALFRSGKDLVSEFKKQVRSKKSGITYRIAGRRHRASAPGETPASQTGQYLKGIGFNVNGSSELKFGNTAKHALYLENGTTRMKPRPGLSNSLRAQERNILTNLTEGISSEL